MVPFEGFEGGLTGRLLMQRGRFRGEAASFYPEKAVSFDKQEFFKKTDRRNADSLRARRRMRRTVHFGGKLLSAGSSSFGELNQLIRYSE
jgi:hypothetical protein